MGSKLRYDITVDETALSVDASLNLNKNAQEEGIVSVGNYLRESLLRGISVNVVTGIVQATGAFTFTGLPSDAETLTINGVTFTARTSGATGDEFNIGADATATATNMAAAVNASVTAGIVGVVSATSAAGVVTITSVVGGFVGNSIPITESMTNLAVSGALLTGGAEGTTILLASGI